MSLNIIHCTHSLIDVFIFVYIFLEDWSPEKCSLNELFRAVQISVEAALLEPMTSINGCIIIFDMTGITFRQLQYVSIPFVIMLIEWIQVCYEKDEIHIY